MATTQTSHIIPHPFGGGRAGGKEVQEEHGRRGGKAGEGRVVLWEANQWKSELPLSSSLSLMLRSYVFVSLLNETADLETRGKPLPDQPMGLTVGDEGETDARRRLSSCAPPNFNLNAEDAEFISLKNAENAALRRAG